MPPLRKAARGKRRWVGVEIDANNIDQGASLQRIAHDTGSAKIAWNSDDGRFLIFEVKLEEYAKFLELIEKIEHMKSITSSGKIRLVKSRIALL